VPKFRIELRNVGQNDLLLNLGFMPLNGEHQYLNVVYLKLVDEHRESKRLDLRTFQQVGGTREEALFLPIPVGATFSIPVDLDNYSTAAFRDIGYKPMPGSYWLEAQFLKTDHRVPVVEKDGAQGSTSERSSGNVNAEIADPITSNKLRFEVPSRLSKCF
jgi:hypothetical protein